MILENGQRVLFTGDSITDCGRREAAHAPLGNGYVSLFAAMMDYRHPELNLNYVNTGIGGNTVEDLRSRWQDDVISYKPDFLSIKIGINDCNRFLTNPDDHKLQSSEDFADIYHQILDLTSETLPATQLLLIAPFFASSDATAGSYRKKVCEQVLLYIETARKLSAVFGTLLLETQPLYDAVFKHKHPKVFFPHEPVHPNHAGHLMMAEAVYETLAQL